MRRTRRPQAAEGSDKGQWDENENWNAEDVGVRPISDKKVRKVRRDVQAKAARMVEEN